MRFFVLFLILMFNCFSFCISDDVYGGKDEVPKRIVSISPEATEVIFAIGKGNNIVGISSYCNFPEGTKEIEKVGSFSYPSLEKVLSLNPDLIIAAGIEQDRFLWKVKKLGIPVFIYSPESISDMYSQIMKIGILLGVKKNAGELIGLIRNEIKANEGQRNKKAYKPRIYLEISEKPFITVSKGSFINEIIKITDAVNVAENGYRPYPVVSAETVINWNPEIIIIAHHSDSKDVIKRTGWGEISAVRDGYIITDLNPDVILRAGPRIIEGVRSIRQIINSFKKEKSN